ncbi:hypothetical protein V5O48_005944 [Marasmius crinis-equi]|uniref:Tyrosinase copper-binding domain-containing protein n=1 Tax=Marasmius crinis-equi TaxID=585013 RepID=A0ABR3FKW4_9AGAR
MYFSAGIAGLATLLITFLPNAVYAQDQNTCTSPSVRKEWRQLSDAEKDGFHQANICLLNKPQTRYPNEGAVVTRLDDLTWTHTELANVIHNVANFLPWHRLLVNEHEKLLRECGYTGPYPYWDWTIDADADTVPTSPIWDPTHGFGGNGVATGNSTEGFKKCVTDGPYANLVLHVGSPTTLAAENLPHCLIREFNNNQRDSNGEWVVGDMRKRSYDSAVMEKIYAQEGYFSFEYALEQGPHGALHNLIGGDMRPHDAPNDPIFYMHHANIDRVWAKWQGDNATRLHDYRGFNDVRQTQPASINDTMPTLNLLDGEVTVRDYMNTKGGPLCYEYSDSSSA